MSRTLRVGFAMGGGVSLGTFNGAALTEVLKLLILRGHHDNIVVDVFSGASAGSMSLGIMLRGLVHRTSSEESAARDRLINDPKIDFMALSPAKRRQMVAAEVVQDKQRQIWVKEINLDRMLRDAPQGTPIRFTAGLLNRGAVEEIAKKHLEFPDTISLGKRQILADRVLFASAISNVTPILHDARREMPAEEMGFLGLADGMTSKAHRELRVFDLHFNEIPSSALKDLRRFPSRWCRYHAGPKVSSKFGIGSLFEKKGWAKIAATSVASGAFPGAFEPVVLERRQYEYGGRLWPKELKGRDRHCFTFVDGGTFNNEPIREAFRLASFIDSQPTDEEFDRCIVFVDPNVASTKTSLFVPVHQRFFLEEPNKLTKGLDGYDVKTRESIDRLIPQLGSLVSAIQNESRVIESDKIFQVRKRFDLRNKIRRQLDQTLCDQVTTPALRNLTKFCSDRLNENREFSMIPAGALTSAGEIARVIREESGQDEPLAGLAGKTVAEIEEFIANPGAAPAHEKSLWLRALTFVAVDRIMDLEGKLERSSLVAIAPITDPADPVKRSPIALPGGKISGFGGFTSEIPGEFESKLGRYCARQFLEGADLIKPGPGILRPKFTKAEEDEYKVHLEKGMNDVCDRVVQMVAQGNVPWLSAVPRWVLQIVLKSKFEKLAEDKPDSRRYEFRIQVPNKNFEFDGMGKVFPADRDIRPEKLDGKFYLITFADCTRVEERIEWSGTHLKEGTQAITLDRDGTFKDRSFCTIRLPNATQIKAADMLGYPIFVARITTGDQGKNLTAARWKTIVNGAQSLEQTVLGEL